jgi:hypothetical protein
MSLRLRSVGGADGAVVVATVTIGGEHEEVSLALGPPPPLPPACGANEERICGECRAWPRGLACPAGQRVDYVMASGDDGSCSCDEYCATDWEGAARAARPHWTGATSAFGPNSSTIKCGGQGQPPFCVCVQATHFCPKIPHLCKDGCNRLGLPAAQDFCVPI